MWQSVSGSQKLTSTQPKSTKNTSLTIKTMETSQLSTKGIYQTLNSWLGDFLAKLSVWLVSGEGLTTQEVRCFLKSQELLNKSSHAFYSLRTSKGCYLTTKETRSILSSPRLMNWGMTANGKCLTAKISGSHKTGKECSLSDILEEHPDQKYFLSEEAAQKIKIQDQA